ncbi:hypothetical protein PPERSA_03872 [Pseudocohnilembus persalinus]|uniref:Uncharacterized protein n=1 Tax=Pseudocohnilembus persalinus TaxID=266149 RepID=A0A0V0Q995_PSEPJ|nr:hypothetical protein PPERSA_03872 [Pseudocohnilembus persalinus]|eukprot:KRW98737.1 hypothetical protein PPERSA_03872 [Pseudocohnilembus persalinus]
MSLQAGNRLYQEFLCEKIGHKKSPILYMKFTQNQNELLQCQYCNNEDKQEVNKKLFIEQVLNYPVWKIVNYPPLEDKHRQKEIKNLLEKQERENNFVEIQLPREQIDQYFLNTYNKIKYELDKLRKQIIQDFEKNLNRSSCAQVYDIKVIKEGLKKYINKEINIDKLFQIQLDFIQDMELNQNLEYREQTQQEIQQQLEMQWKDFKIFFDFKLLQLFQDNDINQENIAYQEYLKQNKKQQQKKQEVIIITYQELQEKIKYNEKILKNEFKKEQDILKDQIIRLKQQLQKSQEQRQEQALWYIFFIGWM